MLGDETTATTVASGVAIDAGDRRGLLKANLDALVERGAIDGAARARVVDHFEAGVDDERVVALPDGVTELTRGGRSVWTRAHAGACDERIAEEITDGLVQRSPLVICGVAPPWSVLGAWRRATRPRLGPMEQRVVVVHGDEAGLATGLSLVDMTGAIGHRLFDWMLGRDAIERFENWLRARSAYRTPDRVHVPAGAAVDRAHVDAIGEAIRTAMARQQADEADARSRVDALYARVGAHEAHQRLLDVGFGASKRILLLTSAQTAYLRVAIEDLAGALDRLGHETRVLCEPSSADAFVAGAFAGAIADFEPHLVIGPNMPRQSLGGVVPDGLAYVCWVLDTLGHLFDRKVGESSLETDLFAGVATTPLASKFGYRPDAVMPYCVPVCGEKFHPRPVSRSLWDRHACEIAFVSNHGESPDALADRLRAQFGPSSGALLDRLIEGAGAIASEATTRSPREACERLVCEALGAGADDAATLGLRRQLTHAVVMPIAARVFRHECVAWTARIAERRGWRFRLYGAGWAAHPALEPFAAGPIEHGESLRACYQAAAAHLHIDLNTPVHQRVLECALSGGLPIWRYHADALDEGERLARDELLREAKPTGVEAGGARISGPSASALARAVEDTRERAGRSRRDEIGLPQGLKPLTEAYRTGVSPLFDACSLFGEPAEMCFATERQLEQLIERAIEDVEWRDERSRCVEAHARRHQTMDVFARRLMARAAYSVGKDSFNTVRREWMRHAFEVGFVPPSLGMSFEAFRERYADHV